MRKFNDLSMAGRLICRIMHQSAYCTLAAENPGNTQTVRYIYPVSKFRSDRRKAAARSHRTSTAEVRTSVLRAAQPRAVSDVRTRPDVRTIWASARRWGGCRRPTAWFRTVDHTQAAAAASRELRRPWITTRPGISRAFVYIRTEIQTLAAPRCQRHGAAVLWACPRHASLTARRDLGHSLIRRRLTHALCSRSSRFQNRREHRVFFESGGWSGATKKCRTGGKSRPYEKLSGFPAAVFCRFFLSLPVWSVIFRSCIFHRSLPTIEVATGCRGTRRQVIDRQPLANSIPETIGFIHTASDVADVNKHKWL